MARGWEDKGLEGKHQTGLNWCWDAVQKSQVGDYAQTINLA